MTSNQEANIETPIYDEQEQLLDTLLDLVENGSPLRQCSGMDKLPWVLCIDDDIDFSVGLSKKLEAHDFGVINAYDGRQGCHAAVDCPPDAIILDYNMPNGRGDEVLQRLKSSATTRDIPVIVLTGETSPAVRLRMMNLGAVAYFTKPVDFIPFVNRLLAYLEGVRSGDVDADTTTQNTNAYSIAHNAGSNRGSNSRTNNGSVSLAEPTHFSDC